MGLESENEFSIHEVQHDTNMATYNMTLTYLI